MSLSWLVSLLLTYRLATEDAPECTWRAFFALGGDLGPRQPVTGTSISGHCPKRFAS
jgi:hypothetical protein